MTLPTCIPKLVLGLRESCLTLLPRSRRRDLSIANSGRLRFHLNKKQLRAPPQFLRAKNLPKRPLRWSSTQPTKTPARRHPPEPGASTLPPRRPATKKQRPKPSRIRVVFYFLSISAASFSAKTAWDSHRPSSTSPDSATLNPSTFQRYHLTSKTPSRDSTSILTLTPTNNTTNSTPTIPDTLWHSAIFSVRIRQPQLQIERDYTPLPPLDTSTPESNSLRFLVKREDGGEVSRYLHGLREGDPVDVRGPFWTFEVPESVREVVFVAGGTGVAAAAQAAAVLRGRGMVEQAGAADGKSMDKPRMTLLWASRTHEAVAGFTEGYAGPAKPAPSLAELLAASDGFDVETRLFVDEDGGLLQRRDLGAALGQRPGGFLERLRKGVGVSSWKSGRRDDEVRRRGERLVLVCGSEGFVEYVAGRKGLRGGVETQGEVGGLLAGCDLRGWRVWKL